MDNEYLQKHIAVRKDDIPEQYKQYYYDPQILSSINTINILNIMNVRGYCDINDNKQIYVLSEDIARGIGLERIDTDYRRPISQDKFAGQHTGRQNYLQFTKIRWSDFNKYIQNTFFFFNDTNPNILNKLIYPVTYGVYIPVEVILKVLMDLRNDTAKQFQYKLITIIVPQILELSYNNKVIELQREIERTQQQYQIQIQNQQEQLDEQKRQIKHFEDVVGDLSNRADEVYLKITRFKDDIREF